MTKNKFLMGHIEILTRLRLCLRFMGNLTVKIILKLSWEYVLVAEGGVPLNGVELETTCWLNALKVRWESAHPRHIFQLLWFFILLFKMCLLSSGVKRVENIQRIQQSKQESLLYEILLLELLQLLWQMWQSMAQMSRFPTIMKTTNYYYYWVVHVHS